MEVPDWCRFGVRPKCAPTVRDRAKRKGSSTPTLNERAATGADAGYGHQATTNRIVLDDLQEHFMQSFVAVEDRSAYVQHGLNHHGKYRIAVLDELANPRFVPPRPTAPTSSPYALSVPRMWFSRSISLRLSSFLLASSERIFCISMFLTWTARYQPSRITPRASLRSVLLRIVDNETRIWRASTTTIPCGNDVPSRGTRR